MQWFLENGAPGNAWADFSQYMRCCHDGRGVRSGVYSLRQAAMAGYIPAQFELSTVYLDADAGYPPAIYNLGIHTQRLCLDPVTGLPAKPVIPGTLLYTKKVRYASYNAGMDLIRKAAKAGYEPALRVLGIR